MKLSRVCWITVLAAGLTSSLVAGAKLAKTGGASAAFRASGPAGLGIDGTTGDVSVGDDGATLTVTVGLTAIKTGIDIRDDHTRKALESQTYATAELKVPRSALKFPAAGAEESGDAKGKMTLHGQSKDVTVHYKAKRDGDVIHVKGSTRLNMNDFGIKPPSYLGVGVKPEVDVAVLFEAKDG